jgi:hypothetical protein
MDKLSSENKFAIIPEWVIELDVSHTAFRLYAVLARYADNVTHQAFPSLETLADRLACSEKTVRRAIEDLVRHGAIKKHNRGRYNSNLYTVMASEPEGTKMSVEGTEMSSEGTNLSSRWDTNVQVTRTTELEPLNVEPLNDKTAIVSHTGELFDKFWATYPNSNDKPRARREFDKAIKRVGFDTILAGAVKYRDDPNRSAEYTKHPSTWLHNDSWDNPLLPAPAVRGRKLTNAEEGALLAQRERGLEQAALEQGDTAAGKQLEADVANMFRSI